MKRLTTVLAALLLCAALTVCAAAEGSGLIGVCMQNMSLSISELEAEALRATFEPLGYEVQVVSADDSVSAQVQQVQNFILMDAEMLVVLPCQIETLEDSLLEAREAGIKVVISGGTGTIPEDAYDAVSADDEYMIGMYVAAVAKTWIEQNMDPDGDWDVAFISSTISDDATMRCLGEAQIVEPWLRNAQGIALIPEDRKEQGVILHNTVQFNTSLSALRRVLRAGFIDGRRNAALAEHYRQELRIKVPSVRQLVVNLSGGNQQKVVLAKALAAEPDVIIFDEPTKGIDVGAKQEIYQLINALVGQGKAVLMVSSDMEEILGMSDRIIVLHEGRIAGELERARFSQENVLRLASGIKAEEA